ncbi:MAG: FMN-binding protein, partial [Oscillospiraceae bacterium]|nr:FMN-binding protein [Oscillospiraceae bacterium]
KILLNTVCMAVLVIATASMGLVSKAKEKPLETAEQITTELATEFSTTVLETISEIIATTESNSTEPDSTQAETENLESETTENHTEISEIATTAETEITSDTQSITTETITQVSTVSQQDNFSQSPAQEETQIDIINDDQIVQQEPEITDPEPVIPEPIMTEPEPEISNTIYHDGTYTAEAFGYDSMVTVTIIIENDIIIDITATCDESDMYYFEEAYPIVKSRILDSQNATVDAVSGSTYSSNAIMNGVQKALDSARK